MGGEAREIDGKAQLPIISDLIDQTKPTANISGAGGCWKISKINFLVSYVEPSKIHIKLEFLYSVLCQLNQRSKVIVLRGIRLAT